MAGHPPGGAMITAATVAPIPVERVPLYHWRPGRRLLAVGSRDGAGFVPDPAADARTFLRPITVDLVRQTAEKTGCGGILAWWNASLLEDGALDFLTGVGLPLVVATAGHGDPGPWLSQVEAWLLLTTATPGPADVRILEEGRHVEVLVGLEDGAALPALPWSRAAAVHLTARRPAEADALDAWCPPARAAITGVPVYDYHHQHSDCRCGERLMWRHAGRSRSDALVHGACRVCGQPMRGVWS